MRQAIARLEARLRRSCMALRIRQRWSAWALFAVISLHGQTLAPRAYIVAPVHSNAITLGWGWYDGGVSLEGAVPIEDARATYDFTTLSFYRTLNCFGRSANFTAVLPYGVGNFSGTVENQSHSVYRSGLGDSAFRISVNLIGGPAMSLQEYRDWRQRTLLGASVTVVAPTGQYDPARLINNGSNRWSTKPELGLSRRWNRWVLDAYGGVWLYAANHRYFTGHNLQQQDAIGVIETHLSYDLRPRLWFSVDGNFWSGGATAINGAANALTRQQNSRVGVTASFPVSRHNSVKLAYSRGAYIRFGGDFNNVSAAWQYSWIGRLY